MRVNVDEAALSEPRIRRMAKRLGLKHYEVLGRILHVWMLCYQRRSAIVDGIDIDIAAGDLDGFADAMLAENLADRCENGVYVRGVTQRIEFLEKQAEKGRKSGESRRKHTETNHSSNKHRTAPRTHVQPQHEQRLNRGSTDHRTYSPDLDQAPDLDLKILNSGESSPRSPGSRSDLPSVQNGEARNPDPHPNAPPQTHVHVARAPQARDEALTLASLLLAHVCANQPQARIARANERVKQARRELWALTIDRLERIDGFTWGEIDGMITFSQRHSFWKNVVLGADSLRDNWDKIAAQRGAKAPPTKAQRKANPRAPDPPPVMVPDSDRQEAHEALSELREKLGWTQSGSAAAEQPDAAQAVGDIVAGLLPKGDS